MHLTKPRKRAAITGVLAAGVLVLSACGGSTSGGDADFVLNTGDSVAFNSSPAVEGLSPAEGIIRSAILENSVKTIQATSPGAKVEATERPSASNPNSLKSANPAVEKSDGEPFTYGAVDGNKLVVTQLNIEDQLTTSKSCATSYDIPCESSSANLQTGGQTFDLPSMSGGERFLVTSVPQDQQAFLQFNEFGKVIQNLNLETGEKTEGYPQAYYLPGFDKKNVPIQGKIDKKHRATKEAELGSPDVRFFHSFIEDLSLSYWRGSFIDDYIAPIDPVPAAAPDKAFIRARAGLADAATTNYYEQFAYLNRKNITLTTDTGETITALNDPDETGGDFVYFPVPANIKSGTITVTVPKTITPTRFKDNVYQLLDPGQTTLKFTLPR